MNFFPLTRFYSVEIQLKGLMIHEHYAAEVTFFPSHLTPSTKELRV